MPLSPEEKKQRKLEKKAQKQRDAEQRRITLRKEELAREVGYSKNNIAANMKRWYLNNYEARFPHIKQDMEEAWHLFEHCLDVKDFIIAELTDRIEESKLQEAMSWQDFTFKIDTLISDFNQRLNCLDGEYQTKAQQLVDESHDASQDRDFKIRDLEDYYKTVLYIMEQNFADTSIATQGEQMTRRDEESKKGQHAIEVVSGALEKTLQNTVTDIKTVLDDYKSSTEAKRKAVEALKLKDEHFLNMIMRQDNRMAKLCDELSSLQGQLSAKHESRLKLEDLKKDRDLTFKEYNDVRVRLTSNALLDEKQLLTLTTESNNTIQYLERVMEKGEKILRLGALCRRIETLEEKVLPFGIPIDLSEELQVGLERHSSMSLFWRRFANANLAKQKLEPVLEALQLENQELKEIMESTLEIMSTTQC